MEEKQEPIPVYAGVYEEIAEIIGKERIEEFYERFKGQQFVFPMKLYSKEYVMQEISHLQGKTRISDIAKKFGYSERYVRKMLAEANQGEMCVGEESVQIDVERRKR